MMGSQPFDPRGYQGYPPQGQDQGRGLALGGLILGIVALLLFWIPAINVLAVVIAIIGLGLGIGALVIAGRARSSAKGLSVAAIIISAAALVLSILAAIMWASLFTPMDGNTVTPSPAPTSTVTRTTAPSSSAPPATGSTAPSSAPSGTAGSTSAPAAPTSGATASR
ncbi:hypothetical protein ACWGQ2_02145 [Arthrobacter sp. NPDC055585]